MKKFTLAFAILALCAVAGADALRSQIDAMNKTMHTVMMNRDINAFIKAVKGGVTKDFKYSEQGKAQTFDQMVAGMKGGFAMMTKVTAADSKVLSLTERGNSATCTTQHTMMGITMDPKHKAHKLGFTGTSVETYRKEKGKWLMSSMSWKSQQMTMDGKPLHQPRGAGAVG